MLIFVTHKRPLQRKSIHLQNFRKYIWSHKKTYGRKTFLFLLNKRSISNFFVWCLLFETFQLYFNKKLDGSFLNYQLKLWQTLENWHSFSSSNLVCCKFKEKGISSLKLNSLLGNLRNHFTHPARDEKAYYTNASTYLHSTTSKKLRDKLGANDRNTWLQPNYSYIILTIYPKCKCTAVV